jgi:hypothetical protein
MIDYRNNEQYLDEVKYQHKHFENERFVNLIF